MSAIETPSPNTAPEAARAATITGRAVPRASLTAAQQADMYALLDAHFEGVTPRQFRRDLEEKNWVILLEQGGGGEGGDVRSGTLCGFSTLLVYETRFEGEPVSVVYSGDTIVRRDAWGSSALPRTWI